MINPLFTVTERSGNTAFINWTSPGVDYVSWIFVNGVLMFGPVLTETTQRSVLVRFSETLNKCIEIHEFPVNDVQVDNICIRENSRPIIEWNAVLDTVRYRVFHTPFGGSEALIRTIIVGNNRTSYNIQSPVRLSEGWHFFRVESVNKFGIESTRETWRFRAFRIPTPVSDLDIVDGSGSGLFDISITV